MNEAASLDVNVPGGDELRSRLLDASCCFTEEDLWTGTLPEHCKKQNLAKYFSLVTSENLLVLSDYRSYK